MAETYKVELRTDGPWVGCESINLVALSDFGYTDEEWDALPRRERESLLEEWAEEGFWNQGYEYSAEVQR